MRLWRLVMLASCLKVGLALASPPSSSSSRPDGDTRTLNSLAEIMQADTEAPALLGVVQVQKKTVAAKGAGHKIEPHKMAVENATSLAQQNQSQQKRILQLTRTIASLNAELVKAQVGKSHVGELTQQLKMLHARENEQGQEVAQLTAALRQARVAMVALQKAQDAQGTQAPVLAQAQTALKNSQDQVTQLQAKVSELQKAMEAQRTQAPVLAQAQTALKNSQGQVTQLQAKVSELQKHVADNEDVIKEKDGAFAALQKQFQTNEKALIVATTRRKPSPDNLKEVRDYAVGTSLAEDMLALLNERAAGGVSVDKDMALVGVQDTFAGKVQVPEAVLNMALADSAKEVQKRQQERKSKAEREGRQYMTAFARKPGVKKDTDGFLYRIDYAGSGEISDTDTVSIVMTETLPDGTVVKDMDALGTFVSQPLNAYPPLFQKVIKLLNNHGALTFVVPPELAYGDAGYPPLVPPGATMVYKLRVREVVSGAEVVDK